MRIVAGSLSGRIFDAPHGHRTHPMSSKAIGGLFNALGDIDGLTVLDAFAGSGALSFEAISRGAKHAVAIDNDRNAVKAMSKAATELGVAQQIKIIQAGISAWSDNNPEARFDIVLCDPPFDELKIALIQKLTLHTTSLMVLSWPGNLEVPELEGMELVKDKNYGDIQLVFYRRIT